MSNQIRRGQFAGPITSAGATITALAIVSALAGWWLGWIELVVVASGCVLALLAAIPFVLGRSRLAISRSVDQDRIEVGEHIDVTLTVSNPSRARSRRVVANEMVGTRSEPIPIPAISSSGAHEHSYAIRPTRRARLAVGPTVISRADPLGLLRRNISQSPSTTCWVYPSQRLVGPLPVGFAKDFEGPTSDTSPAGDVAFHAIRPYVTGDDRRHIHWLSTAKTGSLMVRHYVDNRRPHVAVLLDDDASVWNSDTFEIGVSIVASIASSMLRQQLPVSVRLGDSTVAGRRVPSSPDSVMEAVTEVTTRERIAEDFVTHTTEFVRSEPAASAAVVVTGGRDADDLVRVVALLRRYVRVILVPVGGSIAVPGAVTITADDLDEFAARWAGIVR